MGCTVPRDMRRIYCFALGAALAASTVSTHAAEVPLLLNGGFESGLGNWTVVDQTGGSGSFFSQTGVTSPVLGHEVPPPPQGLKAAMSDAQAAGSHVLYQDFTVPAANVSSAVLSFQRYVANRASSFHSPDTLDFTIFPNQQARLDVLRAGTDPFTVASGDVLQDLLQTQPGDPLVSSGYLTFNVDLTPLFASHAGETLRLRFAEANNLFAMQLGVDDVSLVATVVPEPAMAWIAIGLSSLVCFRRPRRPAAARARVTARSG